MIKAYNEFADRWSAELNKFWKKVLNISLTLGGASLGAITANNAWNLVALGVNPMIFTICGYVLTFCGAAGLMAKLTKE
jgi:hypothetical protein